MTVKELEEHLRSHGEEIRAQLLAETYRPQAVRKVETPKASGDTRMLGVPTVMDRWIQQALLQVLQEDWDPTLSSSSYGFRPNPSAHQAVARAQQHAGQGYSVVVDLDLEKFFDRVNHDVLMGLIAGRATDQRILRPIHRFLTAGMMEDG